MKIDARITLAVLIVLFIAVRLPGLSTPYQQDEFKTAIAAETSLAEASSFLTHPPLTALLLRADAVLFGGENLRILPLIFGVISALLLFAVVRRRFDDAAALWSVFLYSVAFYSVWASLMLDTDGAVLPTLFLASIYCYDKAKLHSRVLNYWAFSLVAILIVGLLVKLSFILVVGALIVDFLFERRNILTKTHVAYTVLAFLFFSVLLVAVFATIKFLTPTFNIGGMFSHALYYVRLSGRNYLQIVIEATKAVFYLSPLLLVPLIFISRDIIKKTTPFLWYLALGGVFYFILFDFSHGALDKYLMFTIVPLCVIGGAVLSRSFASFSVYTQRYYLAGGALVFLALIALMFVAPDVVPLYPKTEWFARVVHLGWNVLTPFNGGSGPVGFYVSFLVIATSFFAAGIAAVAGYIKKQFLVAAAIIIVCSGMAYNVVFIEEFSFGGVYGSASAALAPALAYIEATDSIKSIMTYNDIGAYELKHMGKYAARFYAAPQFEAVHKQGFVTYKGAFLVVGIPPLYKGFYTDYFKTCSADFTARSGVIVSTVYTHCTWK